MAENDCLRVLKLTPPLIWLAYRNRKETTRKSQVQELRVMSELCSLGYLSVCLFERYMKSNSPATLLVSSVRFFTVKFNHGSIMLVMEKFIGPLIFSLSSWLQSLVRSNHCASVCHFISFKVAKLTAKCKPHQLSHSMS